MASLTNLQRSHERPRTFRLAVRGDSVGYVSDSHALPLLAKAVHSLISSGPLALLCLPQRPCVPSRDRPESASGAASSKRGERSNFAQLGHRA